jgi:urea transporter
MTFCSTAKSCLNLIGEMLCAIATVVVTTIMVAGIFAWIVLIVRSVRHAAPACAGA